MPSASRKEFKATLERLRASGTPVKQALAIALKKLGRGRKTQKKSKKNLINVLSPRG